MGFLSQIANVFTGSESAKAARRAGDVMQQQAISSAGDIQAIGDTATARFQPFADVGQQGVDLAGFLGDPQAQADLAFNNPLFQLSRQMMTEDVNQNAAARSRLTSGDTLERLQQVGAVAAQPFIDRQRQDILNLLNIGQGAAGQQGMIDQNTARAVSDLLTGGASAKAGGIVGAQNARTGAMGNIFDVAGMAIGAPPGTFTGGGSASPSPVTGYGSGLNLSQTPLGINTSAGSFGG